MLENYARYMEIMPYVLVHGDAWTNNIFFAKDVENSDKTAVSNTICAFVDWQLSFSGCGLSDLSRFTTICVSDKLRKMYEKDIVKLYSDR